MSVFKAFLQNEYGHFGVFTATLLIPLIMAAGFAVDYTTACSELANMRQIADGASLAGGGVYDGSNPESAKTVAGNYVKSYLSQLPADVVYDVTATGQTVRVVLKASQPTAFLKIAGITSLPFTASASAISPLRPQSALFIPTKAQGWFYKKISVIVVRPKSQAEEVVGTVTYQPTTHTGGGQGTMSAVPSEVIHLGKYTSLILQMDVKGDGCPLNQEVTVEDQEVTCHESDTQINSRYDVTIRTDDPERSDHLFVDGKQLPKGVIAPLDNILECEKASSHAWEDGGGFEIQDFFYTVTTTCAPDGQFVRLAE